MDCYVLVEFTGTVELRLESPSPGCAAKEAEQICEAASLNLPFKNEGRSLAFEAINWCTWAKHEAEVAKETEPTFDDGFYAYMDNQPLPDNCPENFKMGWLSAQFMKERMRRTGEFWNSVGESGQ